MSSKCIIIVMSLISLTAPYLRRDPGALDVQIDWETVGSR